MNAGLNDSVYVFLLKAYPNVQLRPLILFPFKHFRGSIRRAATPCGQRLPSIVEVSKSKVCKTQEETQNSLVIRTCLFYVQ